MMPVCKLRSLPKILKLRFVAVFFNACQLPSQMEYLHKQWDGIEDKGTFLLYTGGAVVAIYLASAIIGAFESLPLVTFPYSSFQVMEC